MSQLINSFYLFSKFLTIILFDFIIFIIFHRNSCYQHWNRFIDLFSLLVTQVSTWKHVNKAANWFNKLGSISWLIIIVVYHDYESCFLNWFETYVENVTYHHYLDFTLSVLISWEIHQVSLWFWKFSNVRNQCHR